MELVIPKEELALFHRATFRERCGILVRRPGNLVRIWEVPNHSSDDNDSYVIYRSDLISVKNQISDSESILGFFHTHLSHHYPGPSDKDFEGARIYPEYLNAVYHPRTKRLTWYGALAEDFES